ncbi:hypothetical protein B0I35DRAFT_456477 [Stachybotrys elegans]|uniref:Uncharacterized protein n=1 Tax=Stachybotrys elegans TaxID=80388 RepID=A0A8K0T207_9HYPO|nr:hypothetical protein B0I35DRAFT_456477 [Stachybotrys elegans]
MTTRYEAAPCVPLVPGTSGVGDLSQAVGVGGTAGWQRRLPHRIIDESRRSADRQARQDPEWEGKQGREGGDVDRHDKGVEERMSAHWTTHGRGATSRRAEKEGKQEAVGRTTLLNEARPGRDGGATRADTGMGMDMDMLCCAALRCAALRSKKQRSAHPRGSHGITVTEDDEHNHITTPKKQIHGLWALFDIQGQEQRVVV